MLALCLGAILNGKITNKTQKNVKNMAQKTDVYRMRAETRRRSVVLLCLSWERVHQVTSVFCHCCTCWQVAKTFHQGGKFANMESMDNDDQLCVCMSVYVLPLLPYTTMLPVNTHTQIYM